MRVILFVLNFFLTCIVVSCNNGNIAKFKITNSSSTPVDSVYFEPGDKSERIYLTLDTNNTKEYVLDMRAINVDGAYSLYYKQNNQWKKRTFGYVSNGYGSKKMTEITILPDSVVVKQPY